MTAKEREALIPIYFDILRGMLPVNYSIHQATLQDPKGEWCIGFDVWRNLIIHKNDKNHTTTTVSSDRHMGLLRFGNDTQVFVYIGGSIHSLDLANPKFEEQLNKTLGISLML